MANRILATIGASLLALGSLSHSKAAIVEQIINLPGVDDVLDGFGPGNITVPASFTSVYNLFDPSLGTLIAMTVTFDYRFELTMTLPDTGGSGGASVGGPIHFNGEVLDPAVFGGGGGTGNGGGPNQVFVLPYGVNVVYSQPNTTMGDPYTLATFTATTPGQTGTFEFRSDIVATPGPGVHSVIDFLPTSSVKVQYEYTPVPEPAAASLLLAGGLAFLRRRRA